MWRTVNVILKFALPTMIPIAMDLTKKENVQLLNCTFLRCWEAMEEEL